MIIWGSRGKEKQIGSGLFYCPTCRTDAGYQHMRVSRYFTLYFIPIFPMETLGSYVRCNRCTGTFKEAVLQISREALAAAVQPWTCPHCQNRNSAAEASCLSCGQPRNVNTPPPLPTSRSFDGGSSVNPPLLSTTTPPPLRAPARAEASSDPY